MINNTVVDLRAPRRIVVSPEMTILCGRGPLASKGAPTDAIAASFDMSAANPSLTLAGRHRVAEVLEREEGGVRVVLLLAPSLVTRIEGRSIPAEDEVRTHHLPSELRAIALAVRDCDRRGEAADIYVSAKSIELMYETWAALDREALPPLAEGADLSLADSRRLVAALALIESRWREKLSLDQVAAQCGLNREKLTRGFRLMFSCSVGEALAERRLVEASRMLLTTDLPISSVGYENGYNNNASFARAFGRRFGVSPSDFRARHLAA